MIVDNLQNATISREEFEVLPYLDRRLYEETARDRFASLDTNLDTNHPDFSLRLEVNTHLGDAVDSYVKQKIDYLERQDKIKVIELGASLGVISSLYAVDNLYKYGLADKLELTFFDICINPLVRTKKNDFDINSLYKNIDFNIPIEKLKELLQNATIIEGNIIETKQTDNFYTISLAPFTHHHLNIYDKRLACGELERITAVKGAIIVGDLTFSYSNYTNWLKKHQTELNSQGTRVPYAVESFVSLAQHLAFFSDSSLLSKQQYFQHYVFAMKKNLKKY